MDTRDIKVKNVLKRVFAAYEEPETTEQEVKVEDLQKDSRLAGGPHIIQRFYFYNLSKDSMIKFSKLPDELKANPYDMSKKLTTGLVAHRGDHFEWKSVVIKTNLYEGTTHKDSFVVFKADLTPDGGREPGSGQIFLNKELKANPQYKTGLVVTDDFLKDNDVFKDTKDVKDFINIENEDTNSFFYEGMPTEATINKILNSDMGGKGYIQWQQETFGYYRLWSQSANGGELRLPDMTTPKDGYLGTDESMKKLEKATGINIKEYADKEKPTSQDKSPESLADKMDNKSEGVFEPVDEQAQSKKASDKEQLNKKDYSEEPYGGGFSIMQNLYKDQKKNMKIREAAQRVVMAAVSGYGQSSSSSSSTGPQDSSKIDKATKSLSKYNDELQRTKDITSRSADDSEDMESEEKSSN
jgi:hypothetical protein